METPNRIWLANDLMAEYYSQRAARGGLIVTEGVPPSIEVRTTFRHCLTIITTFPRLRDEDRVLTCWKSHLKLNTSQNFHYTRCY